eukprot:3952459-Amphidinium_carterae.1
MVHQDRFNQGGQLQVERPGEDGSLEWQLSADRLSMKELRTLTGRSRPPALRAHSDRGQQLRKVVN